MADYFSLPLSSTDAHTFDPVTRRLSHSVMRLSSDSRPGNTTPSEQKSVQKYTGSTAPFRTMTLDTPGVIDEVIIRHGRTVYVVTKVSPASASANKLPLEQADGIAYPLGDVPRRPDGRRAKPQDVEVERLVGRLEAALTEGDVTFRSDHEGYA